MPRRCRDRRVPGHDYRHSWQSHPAAVHPAELQQTVERTALLEGGSELQILEFQGKLRTCQPAQRLRVAQRSHEHLARDSFLAASISASCIRSPRAGSILVTPAPSLARAMKHLLIVYHTQTGNTGRLADAVCQGARSELVDERGAALPAALMPGRMICSGRTPCCSARRKTSATCPEL